MEHFVSGVFTDSKMAGDAVSELKNAGFTDNISIIAKDQTAGEVTEATPKVKMDDTLRGALTGGVLGAIIGVVASLVSIAIPGLGFLIIGGPLIASWGITGAAIGALTGGLIGALTDLGIPAETAKIYEDRIRNGGVLVTVETEQGRESDVQNILNQYGAEEIYLK